MNRKDLVLLFASAEKYFGLKDGDLMFHTKPRREVEYWPAEPFVAEARRHEFWSYISRNIPAPLKLTIHRDPFEHEPVSKLTKVVPPPPRVQPKPVDFAELDALLGAIDEQMNP